MEVVVGLEHTQYTSVEGDLLPVEICVALVSGQLMEGFAISFTSHSGTAMGMQVS